MSQKNNKNIIMHFKGQEEFVFRMLDLLEKANRYRKVVFTPFLNENELEILNKLPRDCFIYVDGGYDGAERKRAALSFYEEDIKIPVSILEASYDEKYNKLSHPDVLGSLMSLGIEREVIGDILVQEGHIYIVVSGEMEEYICMNLTSIKRCRVSFKLCDKVEKVNEDKIYREVSISSLRLDAIIASITNLSRDKAQNLIKGGKVKVNQVVLEQYDYLCNNNSTVSIQRYGRFHIQITDRTTKKNRLVIRIGKYV